jgi:hypothetical protein
MDPRNSQNAEDNEQGMVGKLAYESQTEQLVHAFIAP